MKSATALADHLQLRRFETMKARSRNAPPIPLRRAEAVMAETASAAVSAIDRPLEFIELPSLKIAWLPLGPTAGQIDSLVRSGKLDKQNVFTGSEACKNAKIDPMVPQAFGYVIKDEAELVQVVTDKGTLASIRESVSEGGEYPAIYLLNYACGVAFGAHFGGRVPTQKEQKTIWTELPGTNILRKAVRAGIPFAGYFDADDRKFHHVGKKLYFLSSDSRTVGTTRENIGFKSLSFEREDAFTRLPLACEYWFQPEHGYSFLVAFEP